MCVCAREFVGIDPYRDVARKSHSSRSFFPCFNIFINNLTVHTHSLQRLVKRRQQALTATECADVFVNLLFFFFWGFPSFVLFVLPSHRYKHVRWLRENVPQLRRKERSGFLEIVVAKRHVIFRIARFAMLNALAHRRLQNRSDDDLHPRRVEWRNLFVVTEHSETRLLLLLSSIIARVAWIIREWSHPGKVWIERPTRGKYCSRDHAKITFCSVLFWETEFYNYNKFCSRDAEITSHFTVYYFMKLSFIIIVNFTICRIHIYEHKKNAWKFVLEM